MVRQADVTIDLTFDQQVLAALDVAVDDQRATIIAWRPLPLADAAPKLALGFSVAEKSGVTEPDCGGAFGVSSFFHIWLTLVC